MAKGTYEYLGSIIRQKAMISPVIDAKRMIAEIDISDEPQESKDKELLMYRVANAMNINGFRSLLNRGLYVDTKQLFDERAWNLLIEKMAKTAEERESLAESFRKIRDGEIVLENQLCMVPNGIELKLSEEMSFDQIEDYLRSIAI